jgi:hypothetical protein
MNTNIKSLIPTRAGLQSNIKLSLILTPAIFLLTFWILTLSSSDILASIGLLKMILWALILSFGAAYSVTLFVKEIMGKRDRE